MSPPTLVIFATNGAYTNVNGGGTKVSLFRASIGNSGIILNGIVPSVLEATGRSTPCLSSYRS